MVRARARARARVGVGVWKLPSPELLCGCTRETRRPSFESGLGRGSGSGRVAPTVVLLSHLGCAPGPRGTLRVISGPGEATLTLRGSSRGHLRVAVVREGTPCNPTKPSPAP